MAKIHKFAGTVKEVRTFGTCVILFLTASKPKKIRTRVVRFCVNGYNCHHPLEWAMIEVGAEVEITCKETDNNGGTYYSVKVTKSEVINAF